MASILVSVRHPILTHRILPVRWGKAQNGVRDAHGTGRGLRREDILAGYSYRRCWEPSDGFMYAEVKSVKGECRLL